MAGAGRLDPREGLAWLRGNRARLAKGLAVAAALLLLWGGWLWWRNSSCVVESFTPSGVVSSPNTMLQVRFSKPVFAKGGDLAGAITVSPPLAGAIRLADDRTLVMEPSQPLAPSTEYQARLDTAKLSTNAFRIEGSSSTSFSTEAFAVKSLRLYYNWDLLHQNEVELVGEADFNYPVEEAEFRRALSVSRQGQDQGVTVEQGLLPTRYIFKVSGFQREDSAQTFQVKLAKGLLCQGCGLGLPQDYQASISLDPLPRFELQDVQLHHEPGRSLVAVQFTLPVTQAEVQAHLSVARVTDNGKAQPVPFEVESEYAYAVISADFLPNVTYRIVVNEQMRSKTGRLIETDTAKDPATGQPRRQDLVREVRVEDAPPKVEFQDPGHYLPRDGSRLLAVRTTNVDTFTVTAFRVFKNNLVHYLR
ncbi:MAG TPA: Ig-like domain-containing protein, partial [bacterium]|nr:Ig-like domain-containing protein [bacterium]